MIVLILKNMGKYIYLFTKQDKNKEREDALQLKSLSLNHQNLVTTLKKRERPTARNL